MLRVTRYKQTSTVSDSDRTVPLKGVLPAPLGYYRLPGISAQLLGTSQSFQAQEESYYLYTTIVASRSTFPRHPQWCSHPWPQQAYLHLPDGKIHIRPKCSLTLDHHGHTSCHDSSTECCSKEDGVSGLRETPLGRRYKHKSPSIGSAAGRAPVLYRVINRSPVRSPQDGFLFRPTPRAHKQYY